MADWSKPTINSNYITFVDEVKNRDIDAISLQANPITNPPAWAVKLLRSPVKFQQWTGAAFGDLIISVEGGGTGGTTVAMARGNLGLGTMSTQNANAVAITGGTLSNMTHTGNWNHVGDVFAINATGPGHTLWVNGPASGNYSVAIVGSSTPGQSNGILIQAGISPVDNPLYVANRALSQAGLIVRGDMVVIMPFRCVIPVGVNMWATS